MACLRGATDSGCRRTVQCDEEGCELRREPDQPSPFPDRDTSEANRVLQLQLRAGEPEGSGSGAWVYDHEAFGRLIGPKSVQIRRSGSGLSEVPIREIEAEWNYYWRKLDPMRKPNLDAEFETFWNLWLSTGGNPRGENGRAVYSRQRVDPDTFAEIREFEVYRDSVEEEDHRDGLWGDPNVAPFNSFDIDYNKVAISISDYRNVCNYCNIRLCVKGDICGYGPKDEPTPVGANPDTCRHRVLGVQHGDDDRWYSCESCWLIIEEEFLRGRTYTYDVDNHTWVQKGRSPRKKKG